MRQQKSTKKAQGLRLHDLRFPLSPSATIARAITAQAPQTPWTSRSGFCLLWIPRWNGGRPLCTVYERVWRPPPVRLLVYRLPLRNVRLLQLAGFLLSAANACCTT